MEDVYVCKWKKKVFEAKKKFASFDWGLYVLTLHLCCLINRTTYAL